MVRRPFVPALAAALMISVAGTAYAQKAPAPAATTKPAPPAAKPPVPEGLPNNIRVELTITDQAGPGEAGKRTVSMIVADRKNGSVRSSGQVMTPNGGGRFSVALNVDAMPVIVKDGLIRLDMSLEVHPETRLRQCVERRGSGVAQRTAVAAGRIGKAPGRLAGIRSDVGSEDLNRADRDDPEVALYCDDATRIASSASLAFVLAAWSSLPARRCPSSMCSSAAAMLPAAAFLPMF